MKKHFSFQVSLSLGILTALLFLTACEPKEEPVLEGPAYYLNGAVEINIKDFTETDNTTLVFLDSSTCYIFENEAQLLTWIGKGEPNQALTAAKLEIEAGVSAIRSFLNEAEKEGILDNEDELQKLYDRIFGLQNPNVSQPRGLGFLYQHTYYGGGTLAIARYGRMPSGRDNWASSANIFVSTGLYDRTYFRGAGRWLIPGAYPSFPAFGFNDKTSSVF